MLRVKTRLGLAGRLSVFSRPPDPLAADVFIDDDLLKILNLLRYGQEERPAEERYERHRLFKRASKTVQTASNPLLETQAPSLLPPSPPTVQYVREALQAPLQTPPAKAPAPADGKSK